VKREVELRCCCSRRPLLGVGGRDANGKPYLHVKIFKQHRVYGEIIADSGTVRVRCRECLRWHRITIRVERLEMVEQPLPASLVEASARSRCS
jgi:hypothetical protein